VRSAIAIENKGLRGASLEGVILHPSAKPNTAFGHSTPNNRMRPSGLRQISRECEVEGI